jgi:transposase, IS5 family
MNQNSLSQTGFELSTKRTRKRIFLDEMQRIIPWDILVGMVAKHAPNAANGRPPFPVAVMLRIHFMQQWFTLSDPAMEEALHDVLIYREFAGLDAGMTRIPDESTILRFCRLLETHNLATQMLAAVNVTLVQAGLLLKAGTAVDATLIPAPSSTKNSTGERDPEMTSSKKGNNYHFGMKAHLGVDADSGLVHTVHTTTGSTHDVTQAHALLHGQEEVVFADSGYRGVTQRDEIKEREHQPEWQIAMMPSKRKQLDKTSELGALLNKIEKLKASVRAKVEHPFQVIKCQWGYRKTRYKGLAKNTAQITVLFALSNLWMARRAILSQQLKARG